MSLLLRVAAADPTPLRLPRLQSVPWEVDQGLAVTWHLSLRFLVAKASQCCLSPQKPETSLGLVGAELQSLDRGPLLGSPPCWLG